MTNRAQTGGRLSTMAAAFVVARRDFIASLWSRNFIFFVIAPMFMVVIGGLAGGIGQRMQAANEQVIGIAMPSADVDALLAAEQDMRPRLGGALPKLVVVKRLAEGDPFDPAAALKSTDAKGHYLSAVLSGSLDAPVLTGLGGDINGWQGPVSLLVSGARHEGPQEWPAVGLHPIASSKADQHLGQLATAQAAQTLLVFLTMLLAGMVLSNLVEEKGNKIIEVLAAAIPMDAVFLGKLFAMLGVSLAGIAVWGAVGGTLLGSSGRSLHELAAPAVGWPLFATLGVVYFSMGYLLLGSVLLTIGSFATTVRDVQTLAMPATMGQLALFMVASYAMSQPGTLIEYAAMVVPFSSPYAMLAHAAVSPAIWPHVAALGWQALCVALFVRVGARLFRSRVMKSGPAGAPKKTRKAR